MNSDKEEKKEEGPLVDDVMLLFNNLRWSNAREAIVIQGGKAMSREELAQEVANKRNIPVRNQVWSQDGALVTVPRHTCLPPTLEQMRSGQFIRSIVQIKQEQEAAETAARVRSEEWVEARRKLVKACRDRVEKLEASLQRMRKQVQALKRQEERSTTMGNWLQKGMAPVVKGSGSRRSAGRIGTAGRELLNSAW